MFEQDYIMRLVQDVVRALAKTFLGKESVIYELPGEEDQYTDNDKHYEKIMALVKEGKICEAEDYLYDHLEETDSYYALALEFYMKINEFDSDYLEEHNYSRTEIKQGIQEVSKLCGHGDVSAWFA